MTDDYLILAINPGSTSTKVAVFRGAEKLFQEDVDHSAEELASFGEIQDQLPYRKGLVMAAVEEAGYSIADFDAFVGRGGSVLPCEGGTLLVEGLLLEHARALLTVKHPAALGSVIAYEFAQIKGVPALTVDTADTDEFEPVARISGIKALPRKSSCHALSQKAAARRAADDLGKDYDTSRFVVAHIGGGISVGAHRNGRIIDNTGLAYGEGPMAPTRCGLIAPVRVADFLEGGGEAADIRTLSMRTGGILDHLGTSDMRAVDRMVAEGDRYAALVRDALVYQIAKSIGAYATVLDSRPDAIVLTGGIVHSDYLVEGLTARVGAIAPVLAYPGEFEMEALAAGALRVLRGEEQAKTYLRDTASRAGRGNKRSRGSSSRSHPELSGRHESVRLTGNA